MIEGLRRTAVPPVKRALRRMGFEVRRLTPAATARRFDGAPFGSFGGRNLLSGYRDLVKSTWRTHYWPVRVLYQLSRAYRVNIGEEAEQLLERTWRGRTLPEPLDAYIERIPRVLRKHPDLVAGSPDLDRLTLADPVELVPPAREIAETIQVYSASVETLLAELQRFGFDATTSDVLEIGCGTGLNSVFLAARGVRRTIGLDLIVRRSALRDAVMRERFRDRDLNFQLRSVDLYANDLPSEHFDLVFGTATLEHLVDIQRAFLEIHRLLRPGGLIYQDFVAWPSPIGGHALCTLDFPWGHARLTDDEVAEYMSTLRPHESALALASHREDYNRPRATSGEIADAAIRAGFAPLAWREFEDDTHRALLTAEILSDVQARFPGATSRDLLVRNAILIARKPG